MSQRVAVISDSSKADFCRRLGAVGTIDRNEFTRWGRLPDIVDPCLSMTAPLEQVGNLHQTMHDNEHPPGNMAVLVNATELGQRDGHL